MTIHYGGRLRDPGAVERVVALATAAADEAGWRWEASTEMTRRRTWWPFVRSEKRGVIIYPHEQSEPLRLLFGSDGRLGDFIKTQYAPLLVHVKVVEVLRRLAPEFRSLEVDDEGEYWATSDPVILQSRIDECARALSDMLAREPNGRGPVRLPSGRMVDFLSGE